PVPGLRRAGDRPPRRPGLQHRAGGPLNSRAALVPGGSPLPPAGARPAWPPVRARTDLPPGRGLVRVDRDDLRPDDPVAGLEPLAEPGGDRLVPGGVVRLDGRGRALPARVEGVAVVLERLDPLAVEDVLDPLPEPLHQLDQPPRLGVALGAGDGDLADV